MGQTAMEKLRILADSAKYDASCATSGVERKNVGRLGNASCAGICHSWSADGRCISLLKVLLTNDCVYDCEYCVNRRSADVARASFEPEELADLTIQFYRRNYIEGLFLSSAVERSPDFTAEKILRCLWLLREVHLFAGYIHAKIIPGVSPELVSQIGMLADRLSVNIELPSSDSLGLLAPQKKPKGIFTPMRQITSTIRDQKSLKGSGRAGSDLTRTDCKKLLDDMNVGGTAPHPDLVPDPQEQAPVFRARGTMLDEEGLPLTTGERRKKYKEKFAPAGQSTQMIVGASQESDLQIIKLSESLYQTFQMKRVYFSAYIPVRESPVLPSLLTAPPLAREHRLYQADWLLRYYGFTAGEILDEANPFLDPELDPKIAWALRHIELFPMEVNKVSYEELLRIPGVGAVSAKRIVRQRRMAAVKFDDLKKIGVVVKRAKYFLTCCGRYFGGSEIAPERIRDQVLPADRIRDGLLPVDDEQQISMFQTAAPQLNAGALQMRSGEVQMKSPESQLKIGGSARPALALCGTEAAPAKGGGAFEGLSV